MQKIDIYYNPYKMETVLKVNGVNVRESNDYLQFGEFIEHHTPLQTWIEPIPYKKWRGFINELISDEYYDVLEIHFHGRKIDFEDLKRACEQANKKRDNKLGLSYFLEDELSDRKMAQNIEVVMNSLLSSEFAELVAERGEESAVAKHYANLKEDYEQARDKEFKIVFAGLYSSGKSTILNTLIGREILPTSDDTCTAKTCRIKHDKKIGNRISLECFDAEGKTVVPKQFFESEEECLNKFWEITPLGETKSNPETVDTIELGIDLSHLYPSKEMEKDFNLVIVDTPGCNSAKTNTEEAEKRDISIAIDAITGDEKEMVIICADSQDYEDETIGEFLFKIHKESDDDDKGDFNDRFLFVLNKCDLLKYKKGESISLRKEKYAEYLSNTRKWGMNEEDASPKFVPKIYMVSAYIDFAIKNGVAELVEDELDNEDEENLYDAYDSVYKKVIARRNRNYFLSENCDIPEYRKEEVEAKFQTFLSDNEDDNAIRAQMGIVCIETAIKDYIARYAYPFKVRDLLETFDVLLKDVTGFINEEDKILKERMEDLGKNISEREEVEKERVEEEKTKNSLSFLNFRIEEQKTNINKIFFDKKEIEKIREDLDIFIESNNELKTIRSLTEKVSEEDMEKYLRIVNRIFLMAWEKASTEFEKVTYGYRKQLEKICEELKYIVADMNKEENFDLQGYKFSSLITIDKVRHLDEKKLRKQIGDTREKRIEGKYIEKRNPVKDKEYKWWQIGRKIQRALAPSIIREWVSEEKEVYSVKPLLEAVASLREEFTNLCITTEEGYYVEIEKMKEKAVEITDEILTEVQITTKNILKYKIKIRGYGRNAEALNREIKKTEERKAWLQWLRSEIETKGEAYV